MSTRFVFPVLFWIVSALTTAECLRCHHCFSDFNRNCHAEPSPNTYQCNKNATGCFSRMISATSVYRGCADSTNEHWRACESEMAFGCFFCKEDHCNSQALYRNGTINCVVCQGEECKTKTELSQCTAIVYYGNPQYCFYAMLDGTVLEKGCGPSGPTGPTAPKGVIVTACMGDGCNMELPHSYASCAQYNGPDHGLWQRTMKQCHNEGSHFWHPGCYYSWEGGRAIRSGCLTDLETDKMKVCARKDYREHCQYCLGDMCNNVGLARRKITNRCQTPDDRAEEFCSQMFSRCYATHSVITDGRGGRLTQLYAGCVEPGLNSFVISSQQTHFCDNAHSEVVPCMQVDVDFTQRRSCYQCRGCDSVYQMDHRIKHLCPAGTSECYSFMDYNQTALRGCYHPSDRHYGICKQYDPMCVRCDYDYCNYYAVGKTPGQCYKTRPFLHSSHLMTLSLEDCMGRGHLNVWSNCYTADTGYPLIQAGCVNELTWEDIRKIEKFHFGDMSIVRREVLWCYRCTSNQTDYCYNVRHLEPEQCGGQTQFAIRGCYTLSRLGSIQRGCLTDLDMYHQKMCSNTHFMEICIPCQRSYCNIHRP